LSVTSVKASGRWRPSQGIGGDDLVRHRRERLRHIDSCEEILLIATPVAVIGVVESKYVGVGAGVSIAHCS